MRCAKAIQIGGLIMSVIVMAGPAPVSLLRFGSQTRLDPETSQSFQAKDSFPVNLTVCTFMTSGSLHDLQATSVRFGAHLNVISLDSETLQPHPGILNKKLRAIAALADELSPDAIMVAFDAFDVLIGRPIGKPADSHIAQLQVTQLVTFLLGNPCLLTETGDMYWSFRELMGGRKDYIIFNAEKNCWPDQDLKEEYPETHSPWRYLNAGAFMGNAGAVRAALQPRLHTLTENTDDQRLWTQLYLDDVAAGSDIIHIDSGCKIFQSLFQEKPGEMQLTESGWYNAVTRSHPTVFHANGDHSKVWRFIYPGIQVFASLTGVDLADRFMDKRVERLEEK